jgi:D-amino peptidase
MKVLIAADMEGITGVVHWDQVDARHSEYPRFRRLMTGDVNAAVRGAFLGGADEVIVTDGHAFGRNLLIEELDPRARLNSGTPAPYSMVQGIERGVDAVFFIGYHARIGTQHAILEHTWSDERVANLWINGELFGEIGLNAAMCAHFNAPVILVSGDHAACAEGLAMLGQIETAVVKWATSRMAADCLSPQVAQERIQAAAHKALARWRAGDAPAPIQVQAPISLAVEFVQSEMADKAAWMPGARREDRRVEYTAADMPTVYRGFRALLALARA